MELALPPELEKMIRDGFWPSTHAAAMAQNLKPLIPKERITKFAPEEDELHFNPPPFRTILERMSGREGKYFWRRPEASIHEVDPSLALVIGDFGLGSDAPIILDYRCDRLNPSVFRLRWSTDEGKSVFSDNHWVKIADTFAEFAAFLWDSESPQ